MNVLLDFTIHTVLVGARDSHIIVLAEICYRVLNISSPPPPPPPHTHTPYSNSSSRAQISTSTHLIDLVEKVEGVLRMIKMSATPDLLNSNIKMLKSQCSRRLISRTIDLGHLGHTDHMLPKQPSFMLFIFPLHLFSAYRSHEAY